MTDAALPPLFPPPPPAWHPRSFPADIELLLDRADAAVPISRRPDKKTSSLRGRTQINLFYEASTRTQSSFELAGKRLGADVMNMSVGSSSVKKGETLIDTAMTLNAMRPDILIIRHASAGAAALLAQKVGCSVVNAGDGAHEHPTQALLDALTIRRAKGRIARLTVAICGDIAAFARRALQHPPAQCAWRAGCASSRPRRCCLPASSRWASRSAGPWPKG